MVCDRLVLFGLHLLLLLRVETGRFDGADHVSEFSSAVLHEFSDGATLERGCGIVALS